MPSRPRIPESMPMTKHFKPALAALIQATAVTIVFVLAASLYLGVLDLIFNWVVQRII